jgi:uncharacterized protein YaaQ
MHRSKYRIAMKLIIAIAHERDKHKLSDALLNNGLTFTKLGSTGGFLRQGNVTVLIGIEDEDVDRVMGVLADACGIKERFVNVPGEVGVGTAGLGVFPPHPVRVEAGGAVAFVLAVESFQRF